MTKSSIVILLTALAAVSAQIPGYEDYDLVWEDRFDFLDLDKWQYEITAWGGGNSEFQVYTSDSNNSYTEGGFLYINVTKFTDSINPLTGEPYGEDFRVDGVMNLTELYGACTMTENDGCYRVGPEIPPMMSARLRTYEKFSFRYGRVKIYARFPVGDWKWPAIWMLPEDYFYGPWPESGEIDIFEYKGNEDWRYPEDDEDDAGQLAGIQRMGTTLHWGPARSENRFDLTTNEYADLVDNFGRNFHLYELDWSENGISWYVDGNNVYNVPDPLIDENPDWTGFWDYGAPYNNSDPGWNTTMAPFDQEFHFILNVAVGGTVGFFPDNFVNRNGDPANAKPWTNNDTQIEGMNKFIDATDAWQWTWEKEWRPEGGYETMAVDYIEVYQKRDPAN